MAISVWIWRGVALYMKGPSATAYAFVFLLAPLLYFFVCVHGGLHCWARVLHDGFPFLISLCRPLGSSIVCVVVWVSPVPCFPAMCADHTVFLVTVSVLMLLFSVRVALLYLPYSCSVWLLLCFCSLRPFFPSLHRDMSRAPCTKTLLLMAPCSLLFIFDINAAIFHIAILEG